MIQECCPVRGVREVAENVFVLALHSPLITREVRPGQFLNIRVVEASEPLLRRPFSVYNVDGENLEIIFNVIGRGTAVLRAKQQDECVDVLGPLGKPFSVQGDFDTAILLAGGLGVAPMPQLTRGLKKEGKEVVTFLGARKGTAVAPFYLENAHIATDDGSQGYHGTVVDLARKMIPTLNPARPKIFACGPTAMLRAVAAFAREGGLPCEVSLEGPMACGFGICQGCPVEMNSDEKKYSLMCKDGPVFDIRTIRL